MCFWSQRIAVGAITLLLFCLPTPGSLAGNRRGSDLGHDSGLDGRRYTTS